MVKDTIERIYCSEIMAVPPETAMGDAITLMRNNSISCIVVANDKKPVGILTERDIVRSISVFGLTFMDLPIGESHSKTIQTVHKDSFVFEAFQALAENNVRHLVVVDDTGDAVGVVTQSDLLNHLGYEYFIKVKTVDQVMNRQVYVIGMNTTLFEATKKMAEMKVSFLVICDENAKPVGVLTERDMTRLAADKHMDWNCLAAEVMSSPVHTTHPGKSVYAAAEMMREKNIRRLVVVNEAGDVAGVMTQTDMIHGLESRYIDSLKTIIQEQGRELDSMVNRLSEKTLYLDSILHSSIDMGIIATDADMTIVYYNSAAEEILGVPASDALGKSIAEIHAVEHVSQERIAKAMRNVNEKQFHTFHFSRQRGCGVLHLQARLSSIQGQHNGERIGYVVTVQDITEQQQAEDTIRRLAFYDMLTGLPNRVLFYERLYSEIARARRQKKRFGLMIMDIDLFKKINDTYGHHAGDNALKEVGQRLDSLLRETDTAARLGGDEFAFILPDVGNNESMLRIARNILHCLAAPFAIGGHSLHVQFSIGIAMFPENGSDSEALYICSDEAMYRAKEMGRRNGRSNVVMAD
jgi:diguanylate cyclase (GGDEF)-like protein/PAS domain S-box-containing protein